MSSASKKFATKRLLKDWKELEQSKDEDFLSTVSALPTSNIFVWHCNLRPDYGPYAGTIFHLILRFPESYPRDPPDVELCTWISHPNVYDWRTQGYSLCLDMIQKHYTGTPYTGWTSAYSVLSLLLQIQSFLFAENIPQDYGGTKKAKTKKGQVEHTIQEAKKFEYGIINTHDGEQIVHTHEHPWPPLCPKEDVVRMNIPRDTFTAASIASTPPANEYLPPDLHVRIFSYLDAKGLIQAQNVCSQWRSIVSGYNLFERSQIMCFHTKAKIDDPGTILGIGLSIQYYPDGKILKTASSPLDILSKHAFFNEKVRTGVWGGVNEAFDCFLPLVLNPRHAEMAIDLMEESIRLIMAGCDILPKQQDQKHGRPGKRQVRGQGAEDAVVSHSKNFHPLMAYHLLATLMNSMVVELMNAAEKGSRVSRFASEKALEGYCSFHHMMLFFAQRYPMIREYAEDQVRRFLSAYYYRHKRQVPNLGILLVCLTLSQTGWDSLRKPLVMEAFDRNVLWLLRKMPQLERADLPSADRLSWTFAGARTSLRLLMFQTHFMSRIGRPKKGLGSPSIVLDQYNKQLGKPTLDQKNNLQLAAKEILAVTTWPQFFLRLGGPVPSSSRLVEILKEAIANSLRKRYHLPQSKKRRGPQLGEPRRRRRRRM